MSKLKLLAKYWWPVWLWAVVIVSASGDSNSVQRSSRIIEPLVRWLFPNASAETIHAAVFLGRKWAHLTEYAIFALLCWWALRASRQPKPTGWSRRIAWLAWGAATCFAVTDEVHQLFVPGRQGSIWDVLIDSTGAAGGLFLLWRLGRWRNWW
ncbi:MAG: VanZ family protein [Verrucomicrobiota bacterium]